MNTDEIKVISRSNHNKGSSMTAIRKTAITLITLLSFFSMNASLKAANFAVEGVLSSDLENSPSLTLTITVSNLTGLTKEGDENYKDFLEIILTGSDTNKAIQTQPGGTDDEKNKKFYWNRSTTTEPTPEDEDGDTQKLVFKNVTVLQNTVEGAGKFTDIVSDGTVKLKVQYNGETSDEFTVETVNAIPNEAPSQLKVKSTTSKTIKVSWEVKEEISYTDGKSRSSGDVIVALIDQDALAAASVSLASAALIANTEDGSTSGGNCTFSLPTEEGADCVTCAEDNTFLDLTKLKAIDGFGSSVATGNSGARSFTGLDPNKTYTVFLQYIKSSTRTGCYNISPILDNSLSEAYGEGEATGQDRRCFIATAAYGSPTHPRLDTFRWFRDNILLPFSWGKKIVSFYYHHSPPLAKKISTTPWLKYSVALLLWVPATFFSIMKWFSEHPEAYFALFLLFAAALFLRAKTRRSLR